jgi:hypothetical protein
MAFIRLRLLTVSELRFVDSRGELVVIPRLRLETLLDFGPPRGAGSSSGPFVRGALIDTRAGLSVFPEREWRKWESRVEWLAWAGRVAERAPPRVKVLGGNYPYRVGRVWVTALDADGRRLSPVPVVGQFPEDGGGLSRILVGLHGSILDRRRLVVDTAAGQAWLRERGLLTRTFLWMSSRLAGKARASLA